MPALKTYGLFVSHAWTYNAEYYRLVGMLDNAPNFYWRNYSVPEHDPIINPSTQVGQGKLLAELDKQVRPVNCVLIVSGMYAAYSGWIQAEIKIAEGYSKPIVGIRPWGQERVPQAVSDPALEMVGWNTDSIVAAIRRNSI